MTFTSRAYAGEIDLQPISTLLTLCEATDQLGMPTSVAALQADFDAPTVDQARDLRLWQDEAGRLVAFANIDVRPADHGTDGLLWFRVHPDARNGHLEDAIIAWAIGQMQALRHARGGRAVLQSGTNVDDAWRSATLERHGFAVVRYFLRMDHALDAPIAEPLLPPGFTVRAVAGPSEAAAWVELFNASFIDHWNHHPLTVERLLHIWREPHYVRAYDLIAVASDGTFAAFCAGGVDEEENARTGRKEGAINVLGTRRGFRRMGLGRALLLEGLRRFQSDGFSSVQLTVDAASPTGATRLYESVGFRVTRRYVRYEREV